MKRKHNKKNQFSVAKTISKKQCLDTLGDCIEDVLVDFSLYSNSLFDSLFVAMQKKSCSATPMTKIEFSWFLKGLSSPAALKGFIVPKQRPRLWVTNPPLSTTKFYECESMAISVISKQYILLYIHKEDDNSKMVCECIFEGGANEVSSGLLRTIFKDDIKDDKINFIVNESDNVFDNMADLILQKICKEENTRTKMFHYACLDVVSKGSQLTKEDKEEENINLNDKFVFHFCFGIICPHCKHILNPSLHRSKENVRMSVRQHFHKQHNMACEDYNSVGVTNDIYEQIIHQSTLIVEAYKIMDNNQLRKFQADMIKKSMSPLTREGNDSNFIPANVVHTDNVKTFDTKHFDTFQDGSKVLLSIREKKVNDSQNKEDYTFSRCFDDWVKSFYEPDTDLEQAARMTDESRNQIISVALECIPALTGPRPNPFFDPFANNSASYQSFNVDVFLPDIKVPSDEYKFKKEASRFISETDNSKRRDLIKFIAELIKPLYDNYGYKSMEAFCTDMTLLVTLPPTHYEDIAVNAVDTLVEMGSSPLISLCSMPGRRAITSINETSPIQINSQSSLKAHIKEIFAAHHLSFDNSDENYHVLLENRENQDLHLAISERAVVSSEDNQANVRYYREVLPATLTKYTLLFKNFVVMLLRLVNEDSKFLSHSGDKKKSSTVDYFKSRFKTENTRSSKCGNIHIIPQDAIMVAQLCVENMGLGEDNDRNETSISPAGIFCRIFALLWTQKDVKVDKVDERGAAFGRESPRKMHRAASAVSYMSRLCVIITDHFSQGKLNENYLCRYAYSLQSKDLANLGKQVKKFESNLTGGMNMAKCFEGSQDVPFSVSFQFHGRPEIIHMGMIIRAVHRTINSAKRVVRDMLQTIFACSSSTERGHIEILDDKGEKVRFDCFRDLEVCILEMDVDFYFGNHLGAGYEDKTSLGCIFLWKGHRIPTDKMVEFIWKWKKEAFIGNIEKMMDSLNMMNTYVFNITQLGGYNFGHARATEIGRVLFNENDGQEVLDVKISHFNHTVHQCNNVGKTLCSIRYPTIKSQKQHDHVLSAPESCRFLCINVGLFRPLIARYMIAQRDKIRVTYKSSVTMCTNMELLASYFMKEFGYSVRRVDSTNSTLEVTYGPYNNDVSMHSFQQALGAKINFSNARQLRTAIANACAKMVTENKHPQVDPVLFSAADKRDSEKLSFDLIGVVGFGFSSMYRPDMPLSFREEVDDLPLNFKQFKKESWRNECIIGCLSDAFLVLPSSLNEMDALTLYGTSEGNQPRKVSIIVTPSLFLANFKKSLLQPFNSIEGMVWSCEDKWNEVHQFIDTNDETKDIKQMCIFIPVRLLATYKYREKVTRLFSERKLHELVYTDLPLYLFDTRSFTCIQSLMSLNLYHGTKVAVTSTMGRPIDRAFAELLCPATCSCICQRTRSDRSRRHNGDKNWDDFIDMNGFHDQADIIKILTKTRQRFYVINEKDKISSEGGNSRNGKAGHVYHLCNIINANFTELFSPKIDFVFIFVPSEVEVKDMKEQAQGQTDDSFPSHMFFYLSNLEHESLNDFHEDIKSYIEDSTPQNRIFVIAVASAAYIVHSICLNIQSRSLTVAYKVYGGLATYIQCVLCQGPSGKNNEFIFIHDEYMLEDSLLHAKNLVVDTAQTVFGSDDKVDDLFSNRCLARFCSHSNPPDYLKDKILGEGNDVERGAGQQKGGVDGGGMVFKVDAISKAIPYLEHIVPGKRNQIVLFEKLARENVDEKRSIAKQFVEVTWKKLLPRNYSFAIKNTSLSRNHSYLRKKDVKWKFQCFLQNLTESNIVDDNFYKGVENMCLPCSLPFKCKSSSSSLSVTCDFDRRKILGNEKKMKLSFCDCCYVYHSLFDSPDNQTSAKYHHKQCAGDLLFVYVAMVFGNEKIHKNLQSSVSGARTTEFVDFESRNAQTKESKKSFKKNLRWLISSEQSNIDFWWFVSKQFNDSLSQCTK